MISSVVVLCYPDCNTGSVEVKVAGQKLLVELDKEEKDQILFIAAEAWEREKRRIAEEITLANPFPALAPPITVPLDDDIPF